MRNDRKRARGGDDFLAAMSGLKDEIELRMTLIRAAAVAPIEKNGRSLLDFIWAMKNAPSQELGSKIRDALVFDFENAGPFALATSVNELREACDDVKDLYSFYGEPETFELTNRVSAKGLPHIGLFHPITDALRKIADFDDSE
jgi:hypothetical protein